MEEASFDSKKYVNNSDEASAPEDIIRWFEGVAENAAAVQAETLRLILELNCGVEYLRGWMGDEAGRRVREMDAEALQSFYTSRVPLASNADMEPYIRRIADGDTAPILTQQPITTLSLSSGTADGKQKYVPFTHHSSLTTLQVSSLAAAYISKLYPIKEGGRVLDFIYNSKQFKTKGGLTVGTATTHYFSSPEFLLKQERTKTFTCSPAAVISAGDYKQSTYCHLLLGLLRRHQVEFLSSTFAFCIVEALRALEDLWPELCWDIRSGQLGPRVTSPELRAAVSELLLFPDPATSAQIEAKCSALEQRSWAGLVPELWPSAKYLYSIMTGSMQPYLGKIRHYAGGLPLVSADYGSTESWVGVNVDPSLPPEKVTFAVVPTFSYFEFLPLRRRRPNGDGSFGVIQSDDCDDDFVEEEEEPVPLSRVRIGQEYEVVLTTYTGLYRYRLGDVVEVAGFHKGTPKLGFIRRRNLILTINIDKNTEKDLQLVVERGSQLLAKLARAELVDFTSSVNIAEHPGHYVIYWEIKGEVEEEVLGECCREMDTSFVDHGYVVSRRTNSIGPLELCIVQIGTFRKILDYFVGNGAAMSQFKTPRCISNLVLLRILNLCAAKRLHSTAYG